MKQILSILMTVAACSAAETNQVALVQSGNVTLRISNVVSVVTCRTVPHGSACRVVRFISEGRTNTFHVGNPDTKIKLESQK